MPKKKTYKITILAGKRSFLGFTDTIEVTEIVESTKSLADMYKEVKEDFYRTAEENLVFSNAWIEKLDIQKL